MSDEELPGHLAHSIMKYIEGSSEVLKIHQQQQLLCDIIEKTFAKLKEYKQAHYIYQGNDNNDSDDDEILDLDNYLNDKCSLIHELKMCDSVCNSMFYCKKCYQICKGCDELKRKRKLIDFEDNKWCRKCLNKQKKQINDFMNNINNILETDPIRTIEPISEQDILYIKRNIPKIKKLDDMTDIRTYQNNRRLRHDIQSIKLPRFVNIVSKLTKICEYCNLCRNPIGFNTYHSILPFDTGLNGYQYCSFHRSCLMKKKDDYYLNLKTIDNFNI